MSVKRYYWDRKSDCDCEIIEQPDGAMVDYDEHASVVAELEARCTALAAENAGLKESRKNLAEFIHEELDAGYPLNMSIETPATDSFLAEVRAQESKRVYESILDNPAVTDMESLVDWLEQNANDSVAFAAQLRKGVQS